MVVPRVLLIVFGTQVPVIPSLESGNVGNGVVPKQKSEMAVNVGVVVEYTVIVLG